MNFSERTRAAPVANSPPPPGKARLASEPECRQHRVHRGVVRVPEERQARMRRMRRVVKDHNIYRWAANLITELSEIRIEKREQVQPR